MSLHLRRVEGASPLVVAHRGAAALAPENSLAAVEAGIEAGADMIEVDVLQRSDGALVLAHTCATDVCPTLDAALERIAASSATLLLDLKAMGLEAAAIAALRRYGLLERTLAASVDTRVLRRLHEEEPLLARSLSYPDDRFGVAQRPSLAPAVRGGLAALRRALPFRAPRWIRATGVQALTLQWSLVSAELVERCHSAGAAVFAWTIPDADVANRLGATGIDAMIADDPRLLIEEEGPAR